MRLTKQTTAYNLTVLMVDSTDHVTGKTGLSLTIGASKNGGAFAAITPTVTELSYGVYKLALTTAHTDTVGDLILHITGTGADPRDVEIQVFAASLDDLVRSTTPANTLDVSATGEAGLDFNNIKAATGATTLTNITVPVVTTVTTTTTTTSVTNDVGITQAGADKVWASAARTLTSFGTLVADIWANATRTLTAGLITAADVWGYVTRTLTSAGSGATAQEVWEYAARTLTAFGFTVSSNATVAVSAAEAEQLANGKYAMTTGYTYRKAVPSTLTADLSTATKLWCAIKTRGDDDADGLILIEKTAGLTVVNRAAYATVANGSLTVSGSAGDWLITTVIDEAANALLKAYDGKDFVIGWKALVGGDTITIADGEIRILRGSVDAIA